MNNGPGAICRGFLYEEEKKMQYIYVKRKNVEAQLKYISWSQEKANVFYNVRVLPYRGKKYNPEKYVTIAIG